MRFSTLQLLHDINTEGKLFYKNNYIILNGTIFPFLFLNCLKLILKKKYKIEYWINLDIEENKNAFLIDFDNDLNYYEEKNSVLSNNKLFGFIVDIKEKNDLAIIQKIMNSSLNKNNYYIFFTYNIHESLIRGYSYYSVDDIIYNENKIILMEFFRKNVIEESFIGVYYFLDSFYKKIEAQAYLEFFFSVFRYIPNIKKSNMIEFIDNYIYDSRHLLLSISIFDLATYFFQKKTVLFFEKWKITKQRYSIESWYYFWQDQLWYCQLALLNKTNINDIIFYKKVNRWFLKTGINCYQSDELLSASLILYNLDYLHKKLQVNSEIDLESFFYIWFYRK
jgi:hypothetical protein